MALFPRILSKFNKKKNQENNLGNFHEFCPNCEANLTKQPGYSPELDYWICRSCNIMLTNPISPYFQKSDIVWLCDKCGAFLNKQEGFNVEEGEWTCTNCSYVNLTNQEELYTTENEFQESKLDPFKGLTDDEILELTSYKELTDDEILEKTGYKELESTGRNNKVSLVIDEETDTKYVRKNLEYYDIDVFKMLKENPVEGMPGIIKFFESRNNLIVIEEYIEGQVLKEAKNPDAIKIVMAICDIVSKLHGMSPEIIHRDIKPGNIIISNDGRVYLLDVDAAKKYDSAKKEDTILIGTKSYAAPEQYGFRASSVKTDIYSIGILLNVLLTGEFPKNEIPDGPIGDVIRKCTMMDPDDRYSSVNQVKSALDSILNYPNHA